MGATVTPASTPALRWTAVRRYTLASLRGRGQGKCEQATTGTVTGSGHMENFLPEPPTPRLSIFTNQIGS